MTHQPDPAAFAPDAPSAVEGAADAAGRPLRHDGWTPERQRLFLSAIADGLTVERACAQIGMSASAAYAFRQRAAGAGFALGWKAATLLSRDRVADELMARAMDGVTDTVTRPDGSTWTRHRHDNRTALALLGRLDRMAEQAPADPAAAAAGHAARLVAQDFEAFLATVEEGHGPAAAGLFLARRTGLAGVPAAAPELEPVLALARADRFVRMGAAMAAEVDVSDLDPAARATWTADQWLRAEAAGLLRLAPAPSDVEGPAPEDKCEEPPLPPLVRTFDPVWWDEDDREYRTHFPPPDPEDADELDVNGRYGEDFYERRLSEAEEEVMQAAADFDRDGERARDEQERDRWFAALQAEIAAAEAGVGEGEDNLNPPRNGEGDRAGIAGVVEGAPGWVLSPKAEVSDWTVDPSGSPATADAGINPASSDAA